MPMMMTPTMAYLMMQTSFNQVTKLLSPQTDKKDHTTKVNSSKDLTVVIAECTVALGNKNPPKILLENNTNHHQDTSISGTDGTLPASFLTQETTTADIHAKFTGSNIKHNHPKEAPFDNPPALPPNHEFCRGLCLQAGLC